MKTILSSIIFAIFLNQVQSVKFPEQACSDVNNFIAKFKVQFELSQFDISHITCLTQTELYTLKNVKKMKKFFNVNIYGCDAHLELDGYLKEVTGKNMNTLDKKQMTQIYNQVERCLPKKEEIKQNSVKEESEQIFQRESDQQESVKEESVKQESVHHSEEESFHLFSSSEQEQPQPTQKSAQKESSVQKHSEEESFHFSSSEQEPQPAHQEDSSEEEPKEVSQNSNSFDSNISVPKLKREIVSSWSTSEELTLSSDEQEIPSQKKPNEEIDLHNTHPLRRNGLMGASNECNQDNIKTLKRIVAEIKSSKLMTLPLIYNENIVKCYHQLVSGWNFQAVFRINGRNCKLYFYKSFDGKLVIHDKNAKSQYDFNSTDAVQVTGVDRLLDQELENYNNESDCGRSFATETYIRLAFGM